MGLLKNAFKQRNPSIRSGQALKVAATIIAQFKLNNYIKSIGAQAAQKPNDGEANWPYDNEVNDLTYF